VTPLVRRLAETLESELIPYCLWKGAATLERALTGERDLDLLVPAEAWERACAALEGLGFRGARERFGPNSRGMAHFYGWDPGLERLLHVHLHDRVFTGENLVNSHSLPLERVLLQGAARVDGLRVAPPAAEALLTVLKHAIRWGSLPDVLESLMRRGEQVAPQRLLRDEVLVAAVPLLRDHCPAVDEETFHACAAALRAGHGRLRRWMIARRVRRDLRPWANYGAAARALAYTGVLRRRLLRVWHGNRKDKVLRGGGAVVAFVGPDAAGKSTLVAETCRWLDQAFAVRAIHSGKPPMTAPTAVVQVLLGVVRRLHLTPGSRGAASPGRHAAGPGTLSRRPGLADLLYAVRAVALAWDRRQLSRRARRLAQGGEIVVSDRYPTPCPGMMDGPRLSDLPSRVGVASQLYRRLAEAEAGLYRQIPAPDLVIQVRVSLETVRRRNRERVAADEAAYLERRHAGSAEWRFPGARTRTLDANGLLPDTLGEARCLVWQGLRGWPSNSPGKEEGGP
jgi:thymidylate kinase